MHSFILRINQSINQSSASVATRTRRRRDDSRRRDAASSSTATRALATTARDGQK